MDKRYDWFSVLESPELELTGQQVSLLDEMGFVWDVRMHLWEEGFKYLVAYREEFSNCLVKGGFQYRGYKLGTWVGEQRTSKDKLKAERISRLDELGFVWEANDHQWEEGIKHLVVYQKEHGDCWVRDKSQYSNFGLGSWVSRQRTRKGKLTGQQVSLLDEIGFVWDVLEYQWEKGFEYLVAYKEEFSHCLVKRDFQYRGYNLGTWVSNHRSRKERLTAEQVNRLDALGFVWKVK